MVRKSTTYMIGRHFGCVWNKFDKNARPVTPSFDHYTSCNIAAFVSDSTYDFVLQVTLKLQRDLCNVFTTSIFFTLF